MVARRDSAANGTTLEPVSPADSMSDAIKGAADRKRILLVEGDGFTRLVLLLRLRLAGFVVDFTSNGILGLGKVRHCRPDILLVELKLCGLSGLELIKAARAEFAFRDRPIFVYTHVDKLNRNTRKEVGRLATEIIDKSVISREDLVQIFTTKFPKKQTPSPTSKAGSAAVQESSQALNETVLPGVIEELIAGVREQAEILVRNKEDGEANGRELLGRVSSLGSCATAAGLANLARHAKALENFLGHLSNNPQACTDATLATVTRSVEVMSQISLNKPGKEKGPTKYNVVFIDEIAPSNQAMEQALLKASLEPVCFEEPKRAREYLACHKTQLVLANVALPEAHGLAVSNIRELSLHSKTPVIFGPERMVVVSFVREEAPGSAQRLDKLPLVLTELVVRALNEIQSPRSTSSPKTAAAPVQAAAQPVSQRVNAAASLPVEDGFELFARSPSQAESPAIISQAMVAPGANELSSVDANKQPLRLHKLFDEAGIPDLPIMRAEPAPEPVDNEAPNEVVLPTTSEDGVQVDERPLEAFPFPALRAEPLQVPKQESGVEDQTAPIAWTAEPVTQPSEDYFVPDSTTEPETEQPAAIAQPAEPTVNDGQVMNTELLGLAEHRAQARCAELEQEVAALRQALEGLNSGPSEPQQSAPDLTAHVQELEQRMNEQAAELEKQKEDKERLASELGSQVQANSAANEQNEAARHRAESRCAQLEQELAAMGKEREANEQSQAARQRAETRCAHLEQELAAAREAAANKPAQTPKIGAVRGNGASSGDDWSGLPASELEQLVRQGVAALAKATAELAKERGERQRAQQLATDLNGRLQTLHHDFSRTMQAQGENLARITSLEQEHNQTKQALEKSAADVEQHQAERAAAELELQKTKDINTQLRKDATFFEEANKRSDAARQELQGRLESSLNAAREQESRLLHESSERKKLADSLEIARRENEEQARKHEIQGQELKTANDALQDREARLQKETAERQRLAEAMEGLQRGSQDHPDRDLEFSKVQSALQSEQVERMRQESQMAHMRQSTVEATHAARSLRTNLRRQIREPVDNLVHSTRSLLELEMGDEQKRLAEAVLQDVLLVQTRLREPGLANADGAEPATEKTAS